MGDLLGSPRERVSHGYETHLGESSTRMGDLLGSPRERVSYLAYPNLFGTKSLEKKKMEFLFKKYKLEARSMMQTIDIV